MIPATWAFTPLEQLASVERGKFTARPRNDSRYYGGSIPFVQTGDVVAANGIIKSYSQTLNENGLRVSKLFPKGSILITIAANIGDIAMTSIDVACPDSIVVAQAYPNVCNAWLRYALSMQKSTMEAAATQNAQKNINLQVLRPLLIPTPPIAEQKKIAEILTTWDKAIGLMERTIEIKRRRRNLLLNSLSNKRHHWNRFQLSELVDVLHGYAFSSDFFSSERTEKILLTPGNFREEGGFRWMAEKQKYYSGVFPERYLLKKDDLLIAMTEQAAGLLGSAILVPESDTYLHNQRLGLVTIKQPDVVLKKYLYHYFKTSDFRQQISATASGTKVRHTSPSKICNIYLYLPSMQEQVKLAETLETCEREIEYMTKLMSLYKYQKCGLMQKLLTGKWRVSTQEAA